MTPVRDDLSARLCRALTAFQVAVYEWRDDCSREQFEAKQSIDAMRKCQNEISRLQALIACETENTRRGKV